jgi:FAD/FMN-containing dehydrogenase/Fe-S oxidoreductase
MMEQLTILREHEESDRFARQRMEDSRGALSQEVVHALEGELRRSIDGEVRFDDGSRALYATDGSNYRQVPIGVVVPKSVEDVIQTISLAHRYQAPILARGGGTSLAGQCCNVAVVMDFTKYLGNVLKIDTQSKLGTVQPGCVLDRLREAAAPHGLTFGPDPATHSHCALGGMLGNNSCGIHSLISRNAGFGLRTSDNTHELEIVTYDGLRLRVGPTPPEMLESIIQQGGRRGELYAQLKAFRDKYANAIRQRFPQLPRRVSGYNLDELLPEKGFHLARALVGSESTLVTILEATLHLVPAPKVRSLLVLGYPDIYQACRHLTPILDLHPTGLEGLDHLLFQWVQQRGDKPDAIQLMPPGYGFLLVEFGGDSKQDSDDQARRCMEMLKREKDAPSMKLFDNPHEEQLIWEVREGGLGSTAWVPGHPDNWPGWEDSAVAPEQVGDYLREFRDLLDKYGYQASLYGHFGQGCVHCRISFDLYTARGIAQYRAYLDEAADLVAKYGGSLSGEHGDGQSRAELLPKMFGPELVESFREFKRIWDPHGLMNPGKVVDPYPITSNLRLGSDYHPPEPTTHFHYPGDQHSFARAALRCVGVGNCRRDSGGVMCPSYMVTREEKHSTRGRARLLWEMLNGEVINDGWRSEEVKDALDLCLACKGCKSDCPVSVDMATYKAEFLSHYYEGRLRPRHAYAMGWIYWWARLASLAPAVANFVSGTPLLSGIFKWLGGIDSRRQVPKFAPQTFRQWFERRRPKNVGQQQVMLWPDTFNNHFHPHTAQAAVEVLETLGYQVTLPQRQLCCGRPLYDFGMLDTAKQLLRETLDVLRPALRASVPIVVLEPSCFAVFHDELENLFPSDEDANRLKRQTSLLADFLLQHSDYEPPRLQAPALAQAHCHHRSVGSFDGEAEILKRMGIECQVPEKGCCGMAGSFGFEAGEHYDVSQACGERALLPAVRRAAGDTLIVADGFSCREQIEQGTGRRAMHLAEVLQLAMREGRFSAAAARRMRAAPPRAISSTAVVVGLSGLLLGGALAWRFFRSQPHA